MNYWWSLTSKDPPWVEGQRQQVTLVELPAEILSQICLNLAEDVRDESCRELHQSFHRWVLSPLKCCRALYIAALPHLYTDIQFIDMVNDSFRLSAQKHGHFVRSVKWCLNGDPKMEPYKAQIIPEEQLLQSLQLDLHTLHQLINLDTLIIECRSRLVLPSFERFCRLSFIHNRSLRSYRISGSSSSSLTSLVATIPGLQRIQIDSPVYEFDPNLASPVTVNSLTLELTFEPPDGSLLSFKQKLNALLNLLAAAQPVMRHLCLTLWHIRAYYEHLQAGASDDVQPLRQIISNFQHLHTLELRMSLYEDLAASALSFLLDNLVACQTLKLPLSNVAMTDAFLNACRTTRRTSLQHTTSVTLDITLGSSHNPNRQDPFLCRADFGILFAAFPALKSLDFSVVQCFGFDWWRTVSSEGMKFKPDLLERVMIADFMLFGYDHVDIRSSVRLLNYVTDRYGYKRQTGSFKLSLSRIAGEIQIMSADWDWITEPSLSDGGYDVSEEQAINQQA